MIPKKFKLVSKTWTVRIVTTKQMQRHLDTHWNADLGEDDEYLDAANLMGFCDSGASRILINKDRHHSEQELAHTFFHELVHALLFAEGQTNHDEAQVDRLGGFIHQVIATSTGVYQP